MPLLPHRSTLWLLSAFFAAGLAVSFAPGWLTLWQNIALLLTAALVGDALAAWRAPTITLKRQVGQALPVGEWHTVELHLKLGSDQLQLKTAYLRVQGWINDAHPSAFENIDLPQPFTLGLKHTTILRYTVRPLQRGNHHFGPTVLRLTSPLGLWQRCLRYDNPQTVRVYPDFAKVTQYALLATDNRLSQLGVLLKRRRGEGLDFHQLREYREGDTPRQIDWKATARHRKLISREYQDERDQRILFLLDCGQRMRSKEQASTLQKTDGSSNDLVLSHFDHTLNAMLLLSYVALRQGDAVGLATFAHPDTLYLAPRKSVHNVNRLLSSVYHLEPTLTPPDYLTACETLHQRLDKRTLIVLLTNLRDEDSAPLLPSLKLLRKKHLVLLANLRETSLELLRQQPINTFDDALTYAAGAEYLTARQKTFAHLRHSGVHMIDTLPDQLPVQLINKYWELKRTGVL